jgi:hypothetical protein
VILLPNFSSMKMASIIRFLGTYKRVLVLLLIFAYCVLLLLADPGEFGASLNLIFFAILLIFRDISRKERSPRWDRLRQ